MVEISLSGSGEGLGWATSRGYSTTILSWNLCKDFLQATLGAAVNKHAAWTAGETTVTEVLIMGSELKPEGPGYTMLSRARLG
jgi:hypothetical protein